MYGSRVRTLSFPLSSSHVNPASAQCWDLPKQKHLVHPSLFSMSRPNVLFLQELQRFPDTLGYTENENLQTQFSKLTRCYLARTLAVRMALTHADRIAGTFNSPSRTAAASSAVRIAVIAMATPVAFITLKSHSAEAYSRFLVALGFYASRDRTPTSLKKI